MADSAVICLSHGFHVRNIVFSPLYEELSRRFRIVLVLPQGVTVPDTDLHLLRSASPYAVTISPHRFEKAFGFLRKNIFAGRERTQTYNLISEIERKKHPWLYGAARVCNAAFGRVPTIGRWWQKVEAFFIPGREFDDLIARERPRILLTVNYGTEAFEVRLLRAAHRHGVPSLAIVPSWDNLSSKGVIGENPKHLAVWNPIMHDEAISLYGFPKAAIHICGGLQFDMYVNAPSPQQREEVLQRLGVNGRQPFVVLGTITPRYFAQNIDIVDIVNDAVESGRLPPDLQIVVRLHPQVVDDPVFGDNLEQYRDRAARFPRIKLSIPRILHWGRIKPPAPEDTVELMVLLHGAVASLMPGSTLAIDACALGSPVIGIGFDGYESRPYAQSVRRMFDFTHYRRLVDQGGIRIAESADQLIAEITRYLSNRAHEHEGRDRIIATHIGKLDGASWRRVGDVVSQIAEPRR